MTPAADDTSGTDTDHRHACALVSGSRGMESHISGSGVTKPHLSGGGGGGCGAAVGSLLSFVQGAGSDIKAALVRSAPCKRSVDHRKYLQRQLRHYSGLETGQEDEQEKVAGEEERVAIMSLKEEQERREEGEDEKCQEEEVKGAGVPLRQRQLPASFWQEPNNPRPSHVLHYPSSKLSLLPHTSYPLPDQFTAPLPLPRDLSPWAAYSSLQGPWSALSLGPLSMYPGRGWEALHSPTPVWRPIPTKSSPLTLPLPSKPSPLSLTYPSKSPNLLPPPRYHPYANVR